MSVDTDITTPASGVVVACELLSVTGTGIREGGIVNQRASKTFWRGPRSLRRTPPTDLAEGREHGNRLDRPVRSIAGTVRRALRPGPIKDALHGVPAGHPAHGPLTDVPVGCWVSAAILDLMPG